MPRTLPKVLSEVEVEALFASIPRRSFSSIRNAAAYALMLHLGCRVSEVCDLTPRRIRWKQSEIRIIGKGGRERVLPLVAAARVELDRWMTIRPPSSYLLSTKAGGRTSRNYYHQAIKRYAGRALARAADPAELHGLESVSCHVLRHTFATRLLRRCGNLALIQKALGHRSISTTTIYTHLQLDDLRAVMTDEPEPDPRQQQIEALQSQLAAIQAQLLDLTR